MGENIVRVVGLEEDELGGLFLRLSDGSRLHGLIECDMSHESKAQADMAHEVWTAAIVVVVEGGDPLGGLRSGNKMLDN